MNNEYFGHCVWLYPIKVWVPLLVKEICDWLMRGEWNWREREEGFVVALLNFQ
jgi:hypothetical protein